MPRKGNKSDDDDDYYYHGVPILGVGSMHTLDDKGTRKVKTQIGFIRNGDITSKRVALGRDGRALRGARKSDDPKAKRTVPKVSKRDKGGL